MDGQNLSRLLTSARRGYLGTAAGSGSATQLRPSAPQDTDHAQTLTVNPSPRRDNTMAVLLHLFPSSSCRATHLRPMSTMGGDTLGAARVVLLSHRPLATACEPRCSSVSDCVCFGLPFSLSWRHQVRGGHRRPGHVRSGHIRSRRRREMHRAGYGVCYDTIIQDV